MTPWDGWAQGVHVDGVPWAGSAGDHGVLCIVALPSVSLLLHPKQEQGMATNRQI